MRRDLGEKLSGIVYPDASLIPYALYREKCLWVVFTGLFGLVPAMVDVGLLPLGEHILLILDDNKLLQVRYAILPVFLTSSPALLLKDIVPL